VVPADADAAILRPFLHCPPHELAEAWQAALKIAAARLERNKGQTRQVWTALGSVSTSTEAQEQRILEALREGPKTTDQLRAIGCYQVSARIWKLRQIGHHIETELFNGYATDGMSHARLGRYTLREDLSTLVPQKAQEGQESDGQAANGSGEVGCTA
jgi:hypothetical protein